MDSVASQIVVDADVTLHGTTTGRIVVRDGATLLLAGRHEGSVELEGGAGLVLTGILEGLLEIGSLAEARVSGDLAGQVEIRIAGTLVVEPEGRISAPVSNYGSFTNDGLRAGRVDGRAPDDHPGSTVVPVGGTDGPETYRLPPR